MKLVENLPRLCQNDAAKPVFGLPNAWYPKKTDIAMKATLIPDLDMLYFSCTH
jgi:hypothetical protein